MIQLVALVSVALYSLVSLVVGTRLLLLARKTREWPELLIGSAFLAGGMLGYPPAVTASVLVASAPDAAQMAHCMAQLGMGASACLILCAWRVVFARAVRGAGWLTGLWTAAIMASALGVGLILGPGADRLMADWYWLALMIQAGAYLINAIASLRYGRMLERRVSLGLADPVVANRITLWGFSGIAITIQYSYTLSCIALLKGGVGSFYHPLPIAMLGLVAAGCIVLAFFPSEAYARRIQARAENASG